MSYVGARKCGRRCVRSNGCRRQRYGDCPSNCRLSWQIDLHTISQSSMIIALAHRNSSPECKNISQITSHTNRMARAHFITIGDVRIWLAFRRAMKPPLDSGSLMRCCWAMPYSAVFRRTAGEAAEAQLPTSARVGRDRNDPGDFYNYVLVIGNLDRVKRSVLEGDDRR
jgi:hypothetical protein